MPCHGKITACSSDVIAAGAWANERTSKKVVLHSIENKEEIKIDNLRSFVYIINHALQMNGMVLIIN